jgi:hypothetical protein
MSCQAEGETGWACTQVLNQTVSSPTTPQIVHVGEKNRKKGHHPKRAFCRNGATPLITTPYCPVFRFW